MDLIDNGDLNIDNIECKIMMIKALIGKLKTEPLNNVTKKRNTENTNSAK